KVTKTVSVTRLQKGWVLALGGISSLMCAPVRTLLEKIEADAAVRLPLPAGRQPAQELARYKTFLKVETHRLKILHRAGAKGQEICRARAEILDVLIRYLWEAAKSSLSTQAQNEFPPLALVAI